jgi:integrase
LKEFLDSFIAARPNVTEGTRKLYRNAARNLISYFAPDRRLDAISVADIETFKCAMLRKYAGNTARRVLGYCKQFFRHAVNAGYIDKSPCETLRGLSVLPNRATESYLSIPDLTKLLATMPLELQTLTVLIRLAGLRIGEAIMLRWEQVDFASNRLTIISPKTKIHNKALRTMPLLPEVRTYLSAWFEASEPGEFVFPRLAKHKNAQIVLWQTMRRYYVRAGLQPPRRPFQNMRRSAATDFVATFPQHAATEWLGHVASTAAAFYWRITPDLLSKAASFQRLPQELLPYTSGGNHGGNATARNATHGTETTTD